MNIKVMPRLFEMLPLDCLLQDDDVIVVQPKEGLPKGIEVKQIVDDITSNIQSILDNIEVVNNDYHITSSDKTIVVEPNEPTYIILPKAQLVKGKHYTIKNIQESKRNSQSYPVIIMSQENEFIDNRQYRCLPPRYTVQLFSTGLGWEIIGI